MVLVLQLRIVDVNVWSEAEADGLWSGKFLLNFAFK